MASRDVSIAIIARDLASKTFAKVGAEAEGLSKRLSGVGGKIGRGFLSAGKTVAKAGGYVTAAALGGAGALTAMGVKGAAALETTTTSFKALLGSSKLATSQIAMLQKYAAKTPFSQKDVLGYAQQYYTLADSVGMSKNAVKPFLDTVGNLGAVTGASTANIHNAVMAIAQIGSKGKVSLDNLNQISQAFPGFNGVAAIATATGKSTAQVMQEISSGTLSAKVGVKALIDGMKKFPGAAGAMEKQSQTLTGLWSTFTDTVQIGLTQAFEPMIPTLKKTLGAVTPAISKTVGKVAPVISSLVKSLAPLIVPLVHLLGGALMDVLRALKPALAALRPIMAPLGKAFGALVKAAAPIIKILADVLDAVGPVLLRAVVTIAGAVGDLARILGRVLQPILPVVNDLIRGLAPIIATVVRVIGSLLSALQPVIKALAGAFETVIRALLPELPSIAQSLGSLAVSFAQILSALMPLLKPLVSLIGFLTKLGGTVIAGLLKMFAKVVSWFAHIVTGLTHLGSVFRAIWHGVIHPVVTAFADTAKWLWRNVLKPQFDAIGAGFHALGTGLSWVYHRVIQPVISAVGGAFRTVWNDVIRPVFHTIGAGWHDLVNGIKGMAHALADGVGKAVGGLWNVVKAPVNWIIDGLNYIIRGLDQIHFSIPSWVPFIGGKSFGIDIPQIPHLARGGMTTGPTPFLAGDNPGGREAVLPMNDPRTIDTLAAALRKAGGGGGGGKIADKLTIVEAGDPIRTARTIARYQRARAAV